VEIRLDNDQDPPGTALDHGVDGNWQRVQAAGVDTWTTATQTEFMNALRAQLPPTHRHVVAW
jgi:hypothetical protein